MTQFTWRDVAAPDFSKAASGFTEASRLLQDTIGKASNTIVNFDQSQTDLAAQQLQDYVARNQDPAMLQAGFNAGNLGGMDLTNRRYRKASMDLLAPDKINALIEAQRQQEASKIAYNQARAFDALAPKRAEIDTAIRNKDLAKAEAIASGIDYTGLNWTQAGLLNNEIQGGRSTQLGIDSSQFNYDKGVQGYLDERQATALSEKIRATGDPSTYELQLNSLSGVSDQVKAGIRANLGVSSGTVSGGGSAAAGGASAGSFGSFTMGDPQKSVATAFQSGGLSAPVVAGFLGNFHVEGGYNGSQGDGGSAGGIAQWRGSRREAFIKRNGVDPVSAPADVQAKHVMWELMTPEGRKVAGISDADAAKILSAKTPEEAATLIDRHFERSSGQHTSQRVSAANAAAMAINDAAINQDVKSTYQLNNANSLSNAFSTAYADGRDINAVAVDLLSNQGFSGKEVDKGVITSKLNEIQARATKAGYPINPSVAAEILKRSLQGENFFERLAPGVDVGNGQKMNWRAVDGYISQLKSGDIKTAATNNEVIAQREASYATILQRKEQARQDLLRLQTAAKSKPNFDMSLIAQAERNLAIANSDWAAAQVDRYASNSEQVRSTGPLAPVAQPAPANTPLVVYTGPNTRKVTKPGPRGAVTVTEIKTARGWVSGTR